MSQVPSDFLISRPAAHELPPYWAAIPAGPTLPWPSGRAPSWSILPDPPGGYWFPGGPAATPRTVPARWVGPDGPGRRARARRATAMWCQQGEQWLAQRIFFTADRAAVRWWSCRGGHRAWSRGRGAGRRGPPGRRESSPDTPTRTAEAHLTAPKGGPGPLARALNRPRPVAAQAAGPLGVGEPGTDHHRSPGHPGPGGGPAPRPAHRRVRGGLVNCLLYTS